MIPWHATPHLSCLRWLWTLALALAASLPAAAQNIESVLRPGELIQGHAKWEEECSKCHVRFDKNAQDRLCTDCHKEVGVDMRERTGYHGRQKPQATCRSCHTDHKGRAARIVVFDKQKFDHDESDYALRGKHKQVACEKCHEPKKKYWEAPSDCNACHKKDDVHKGALGTKCADCHTDSDWKETPKFDHDKTRFALKGKHADAKCVDCHKKGDDYKAAPRTCIGCHKKEDDSTKGHKGLYGDKCDSCHGVKAWKPSTFNHDTDTKYLLRGKHRQTKCADCHTGHLYKDKVGTGCIDCHKKDDDSAKGHKGSLGRDCAACHVETGWKEKGKFDHDKTKFPLLGKHVDTKCGDCHTQWSFTPARFDHSRVGCNLTGVHRTIALDDRQQACVCRARGQPTHANTQSESEDEHEDAGHRGHRGQREDEPQVRPPQQQRGRDERACHRPRVVHRTVEPESAPEVRERRHLRQQRVAGRAAKALADAVRNADGEHVPGRRGQRHQRARQRGEAVPRDDHRLAPRHAVGDPPRHQPAQARHRLRDPLHDAHERGPRPERPDEERRQQRINHLAAHVGQQADRSQGLDRAGKGRH